MAVGDTLLHALAANRASVFVLSICMREGRGPARGGRWEGDVEASRVVTGNEVSPQNGTLTRGRRRQFK